jgi:hypothetical protein
LEYYTTQSVMTDPGKYVDLYEGLPDDVAGLVKAVQGVLIHIFHTHRYGVELSEEREQEIQIRKVEDMLKRIKELDNRPIVVERDLDKRLVGTCRDYAVFICSLARHKGIPARARCGFADYFISELYADHWICEYWDTSKRRWVQLDAMFDDVITKAYNPEFDPNDLPQGQFLTGGQAWSLCRAGKLDPDKCGFFDPPHLKGMWFIRDDMLRDFMALNKVEVLPWDCNGIMKYTDEPLPEAECKLWDGLAELTGEADERFAEVRERYESDSTLRMPADWKP